MKHWKNHRKDRYYQQCSPHITADWTTSQERTKTMKLNLTANNPTEERIKAYLEENASATLALKINCGTPTEKDGKKLINRKTLDGFMKYATEEARKLATKGANYACIDDDTVFGWAIHYFEEESIIEKLYNADGTEYKTAPKTAQKTATQAPKAPSKAKMLPTPKIAPTPTEKPTPKPIPEAKKKTAGQLSIFDF